VPKNPNVEVFDRDAAEHGGYVYTSEASLSSRLATQRSRDVIVELAELDGRSVIDMGCGDGYYSLQIWELAQPRLMVAVDAAGKAVESARRRRTTQKVEYAVADVHRLPFSDDSFDVALVQSILHHDDDPRDVIREAFRLAPEIVIHEPNGNNLGLKIIERTSTYHRQHGEKSYRPMQMTRWVREAGGEVSSLRFAGLVPMFCSDWLARVMKRLEPIVESLPMLRAQGCAVYVMVARRKGAGRATGEPTAHRGRSASEA
jgi:2-polyprenyl-3-methyl-5-hydroxy-6-metoxy-1,4-benzoquinol methylase